MYIIGITNKVSIRANNKPPTITIPRGTLLEAPAPKAKAIGKAPNMVANEVIKIGRKRPTEASKTASTFDKPQTRFLLPKSTINIPFFVTKPISITMPISENIFNVSLNNQRESSAPAIANGTVIMIIRGSRKLSN